MRPVGSAVGAGTDWIWTLMLAWRVARSLSGRRDRSEKVENRGQIFSILRRIVVLFNEKSGKYGPIPTAFAVDSFCRAGS